MKSISLISLHRWRLHWFFLTESGGSYALLPGSHLPDLATPLPAPSGPPGTSSGGTESGLHYSGVVSAHLWSLLWQVNWGCSDYRYIGLRVVKYCQACDPLSGGDAAEHTHSWNTGRQSINIDVRREGTCSKRVLFGKYWRWRHLVNSLCWVRWQNRWEDVWKSEQKQPRILSVCQTDNFFNYPHMLSIISAGSNLCCRYCGICSAPSGWR